MKHYHNNNYYEKLEFDHKTCYYNKKGVYHRIDGPACEWKAGGEEWWFEGQLHRIDGPAILDNREVNFERWYVKDMWICNKQVQKLKELRKIINDDDLLNNLLLSERIIL